jgi:hypothetical protein
VAARVTVHVPLVVRAQRRRFRDRQEIR